MGSVRDSIARHSEVVSGADHAAVLAATIRDEETGTGYFNLDESTDQYPQ